MKYLKKGEIDPRISIICLLIIILYLFVSLMNPASALSDDEFFYNCGGDESFMILCQSGDEEFGPMIGKDISPEGSGETGTTGGVSEEQQEPEKKEAETERSLIEKFFGELSLTKILLLIILLILIFLLIVFLLKKKKNRKSVS